MDPFIISRPAPARRRIYQGDDARLGREWNAIKARCTLERLRYKGYQKAGTLASFMQHLGDWGRAYVGVIALMAWIYFMWRLRLLL
jgi:hypothetical protein